MRDKTTIMSNDSIFIYKASAYYHLREELCDLISELGMNNMEIAELLVLEEEIIEKMELGDMSIPEHIYQESINLIYFHKKITRENNGKPVDLFGNVKKEQKRKKENKNVKKKNIQKEFIIKQG